MHQHPRPPPPSASPAVSEQTNPTRTNNPRDRDVQFLRTTSPLTQGSGSSEEFTNTRQEQSVDNPSQQLQRLNQVVQNFHTKAVLIILHQRVALAAAYSKTTDAKRVNRWFNIELDETEDYKEDIRRWRTCDVRDSRPPPLVLEVFLIYDNLRQGSRLVLVDDDSRRWDVMNGLSSSDDRGRGKGRETQDQEVILERWTIELGPQTSGFPPDMSALLPLVYKKSIVLFRSLYTYMVLLPASRLSRKLGKGRSYMGMKLGYRILDGSQASTHSRTDNVTTPLCNSSEPVNLDYSFGFTDSPAGPFSVKVKYRQHCDFRVDDSEELLSSRFLGSEDDLFQPSRPRDARRDKSRDESEVGSLPADQRRHLLERPELGQAYGSLSTFHQIGLALGTSPISALRNAHEYNAGSPPSPDPSRQPLPAQQPSQVARTSSLRGQATVRRSSFSFQTFKAPTLSASPLGPSPLASSPRLSSGRVPVLGSLTEETGALVAGARDPAARKPSSLVSENAIASSTSSSPKPAPTSRYSSSFSHRRARLSSGGITHKTEDDQNSSGRGSNTSSTAQPSSGLLTEAVGGESSGSVQEDDENITDFLKMLERKKDLLTPSDNAAAEASTKRTAAALNRFHKMRESNAALSDSMSSSLVLHRSSTSSSRQLTTVPPMVAATSASTSSSPGKPISPHTPHTPFAPSRLSAAYSHDDHEHQLTITEEPPSPSEAAESDVTAQAGSNVPAIDIPNSPRPFSSPYQRSNSAQRRPLSAGDDIGDLYGLRSASMGAHDRRKGTRDASQTDEPSGSPTEEASRQNPPGGSLRPQSARSHGREGAVAGDGASDSASTRSSAHVYRSRLARGGAGSTFMPQDSSSTLGGAGNSGERGDGGTGTSFWSRGARGSRTRPESNDDDELDLPFAMERSDFVGRTEDVGNQQ